MSSTIFLPIDLCLHTHLWIVVPMEALLVRMYALFTVLIAPLMSNGIDNHQLTDIAIGTIGGVVTTNKGPAIVIMHQYALLGKGYTIHSPGQLEWFKNDVNDQSIKTGGLQRITTLDGYILPLSIHEGLPGLDICPYTNDEWDSLPLIILTGETDWDPSVLDHDPLEHENWADAICDLEADPTTQSF